MIAEILKQELNLPSYDVNSFNYSTQKETLPVVIEKLELTANNFGSISGKRLFIAPDVLNKSSTKIASADKRKFDITLCFYPPTNAVHLADFFFRIKQQTDICWYLSKKINPFSIL